MCFDDTEQSPQGQAANAAFAAYRAICRAETPDLAENPEWLAIKSAVFERFDKAFLALSA